MKRPTKRYLATLLLAALTMMSVNQVFAGCFPIPLPPFIYCELDTGGTKAKEKSPYGCFFKQTERSSSGSDINYTFDGFCAGYVMAMNAFPVHFWFAPTTVKAEWGGYSAKEAVKIKVNDGFQIDIATQLICPDNNDPFLFGTDGCSVTAVSANVNDPFDIIAGTVTEATVPLTAGWGVASDQQALVEGTKPPDDLSDWDPFAGSQNGEDLSDWDPFAGMGGGSSKILIISPKSYQAIPASASSIKIDLGMGRMSGSVTPVLVTTQFERLEETPEVVGDLTMPTDFTHWWQPVGIVSHTWKDFPLSLELASDPFGSKPGFYKFRVNAIGRKMGSFGGWTPWRYFCIGDVQNCGKIKKLVPVANKTNKYVNTEIVKKVLIRGKVKRKEADPARLKIKRVSPLEPK